jgi:hypothetical protein
MSLGNWGQSLLKDAAGAFFGSDYLRDYTHASKTFRTNSYQNAPKLKFLFHTYFDVNPDAYSVDGNPGLLVKEVKLPSYSVQTQQLNQYNRKRIVQTKIRYEPIEITFHDDNNNQATKLWEAYYTYYYNDATKPGIVFAGNRGGSGSSSGKSYNSNNIYDTSISGDDDWGFTGGQTDSSTGKKVPFFKNITVFGFNQHNFTAYSLVNPVITSFGHDTYNYSEGGGVMQNRMTIDYETVVYNYGALDGRSPGDIVTGFGDVANYDTTVSPISNPGANGTILGKGGLVDAVGGTIEALGEGNILGAIKTAGTAYNTFKNTNVKTTVKAELDAMLRNTIQNTPNTRNTLFDFPTAGMTPGTVGTAGAPVIGALTRPPAVNTNITTAGTQYNGANLVNPPFFSGLTTEPEFTGTTVV